MMSVTFGLPQRNNIQNNRNLKSNPKHQVGFGHLVVKVPKGNLSNNEFLMLENNVEREIGTHMNRVLDYDTNIDKGTAQIIKLTEPKAEKPLMSQLMLKFGMYGVNVKHTPQDGSKKWITQKSPATIYNEMRKELGLITKNK